MMAYRHELWIQIDTSLSLADDLLSYLEQLYNLSEPQCLRL